MLAATSVIKLVFYCRLVRSLSEATSHRCTSLTILAMLFQRCQSATLVGRFVTSHPGYTSVYYTVLGIRLVRGYGIGRILRNHQQAMTLCYYLRGYLQERILQQSQDQENSTLHIFYNHWTTLSAVVCWHVPSPIADCRGQPDCVTDSTLVPISPVGSCAQHVTRPRIRSVSIFSPSTQIDLTVDLA